METNSLALLQNMQKRLSVIGDKLINNDDIKTIQEFWSNMRLWDNFSNEKIFDKETLIKFIEVLDNYENYLLCEE